MKRAVLLAVMCMWIAGCASIVVPKPGKITLEDAMKSLGRGLVAMKLAQVQENGGNPFQTGLVPSEAEVTFNIVAAGKDETKLYVELSPVPIPPQPVQGKAGAEFGTSYAASRGNQITVRFRNILFTRTFTADGKFVVESPTDPGLVDQIRKIPGFTVYSNPLPAPKV